MSPPRTAPSTATSVRGDRSPLERCRVHCCSKFFSAGAMAASALVRSMFALVERPTPRTGRAGWRRARDAIGGVRRAGTTTRSKNSWARRGPSSSRFPVSNAQPFLDELAAMPADVAAVTRRFNTLGNLPADPQNLITALEFEQGLRRGDQRAHRVHVVREQRDVRRVGIAHRATNKDTGIRSFFPRRHAPPPSRFASGLGAIAGMSKARLTVSKGPPFPMCVCAGAREHDARRGAVRRTTPWRWRRAPSAPMAIEAMRGYAAFFGAADPSRRTRRAPSGWRRAARAAMRSQR